MKPSLFAVKKIGAIFSLLMIALPAGCVSPPSGGGSGPASVVEMDQNTDPRFFIRNQPGAIGRLKTAGNDVRLDGKRVLRDMRIQNGAHVATGPASAAIIQFSPAAGIDCGLEVRDFRHGRIYGSAKRCGHIVSTNQGVMETPGAEASYHVETRDDGETVFTAINGQASVWRHANPSDVRRVPGYHQVVLSRDGISPIRRVTPGEVQAMTRWRKNFWRLREARIEPTPPASDPDSRGGILLDIWKIFDNSRSRDRVTPSDTDSRPNAEPQYPDAPNTDGQSSVEPQSPGDGTVNPGRVIRIKPSVLDQKPIRRVPSEEPGQLR
ncbi:hypothetical protein [Desulfococcus sp.]|uniref:hypothetical protein n=1 Tax=Desulfococcus sp. TaxID=2025834 RepID=UPI0035948CDB